MVYYENVEYIKDIEHAEGMKLRNIAREEIYLTRDEIISGMLEGKLCIKGTILKQVDGDYVFHRIPIGYTMKKNGLNFSYAEVSLTEIKGHEYEMWGEGEGEFVGVKTYYDILIDAEKANPRYDYVIDELSEEAIGKFGWMVTAEEGTVIDYWRPEFNGVEAGLPVIVMEQTFKDCEIKELVCSGMSTENVIRFSETFWYAGIEKLDLTGLSAKSAVDISELIDREVKTIIGLEDFINSCEGDPILTEINFIFEQWMITHPEDHRNLNYIGDIDLAKVVNRGYAVHDLLSRVRIDRFSLRDFDEAEFIRKQRGRISELTEEQRLRADGNSEYLHTSGKLSQAENTVNAGGCQSLAGVISHSDVKYVDLRGYKAEIKEHKEKDENDFYVTTCEFHEMMVGAYIDILDLRGAEVSPESIISAIVLAKISILVLDDYKRQIGDRLEQLREKEELATYVGGYDNNVACVISCSEIEDAKQLRERAEFIGNRDDRTIIVQVKDNK